MNGNLSVIGGLDSRWRGNDLSNYMSFTRKFTLDVPSGPDQKPRPSPLRKQGSRKKPHRRLGSRLRGNDGLGISGENNHQASLAHTFILRLHLKRHKCS